METNFSEKQLENKDNKSSEKILRKCVHCGFCNSTCPTYNLLGDELIGALIVAKAIEAPLRRIAQNSGQNGSIIIEKIRKNSNQFSYGYDALNNCFEDLYGVGIIDPAKVTRSALQNATSIAAMILTTECLIVDREIESINLY